MKIYLLLLIICVIGFGCSTQYDKYTRSIEQSSHANHKQLLQDDSNSIILVKIEGFAPALHNVLKINEVIYSGGEPKGNEAFANLVNMGIKTIVSVDGAQPNILAAKEYGLRYVHIPIGYDGIEEDETMSLVHLIQEVEGPYYIHCHHGIHRAPAAAAIACIALGKIDGKEAKEILEIAGTSKNYMGLWQDVENFKIPLKNIKLPDLVEIDTAHSFAETMAKIDRTFDNLKLCQQSNWIVSSQYPDLLPAHEALMLKERFRESSRNISTETDMQFKKWLQEAESYAQKIEAILLTNDYNSADEQFINLKQACKECHKKYRN